jgi:hypothetical protein
MQGGGVQAQGDLLPGQRRAEPDLAPGGEESTRSSSSRPSNVSNNVASGSGSPVSPSGAGSDQHPRVDLLWM